MTRTIIRPDELASLMALAIWQNPGEGTMQLPGADAVSAGFSIPRATAEAALSRLETLGLASPAGTAVARDQAGPVLGIMAAAGACRLKALSSSGSSADALSEAGELLLRTGRNALRGNPPPAKVTGMALKILQGVAADAATDVAQHAPWKASTAPAAGQASAAVPPSPGRGSLSAVLRAAFEPAPPNPAPGAASTSRRSSAHGRDVPGARPPVR